MHSIYFICFLAAAPWRKFADNCLAAEPSQGLQAAALFALLVRHDRRRCLRYRPTFSLPHCSVLEGKPCCRSTISRWAAVPRRQLGVSHRCASRLLKRCFNAPLFCYYFATLIVRAICGAGRQRAASTTAPIDAHSMRAVLMLTLSTSGVPLQGQLGYFGGLMSIPVTVEDC